MPRYIAGFNMPGYLPETDPQEFETLEEAQRYIIDELKSQEDKYAYDNEEASQDFCHEAEDINVGEMKTNIMPDGYIYWISEA